MLLRLTSQYPPPDERVLPVPLRDTLCGLPGALSVTESVPLMLPVVLGVKVTLIVQVATDARLGTQLSVSLKLELAVMSETLRGVVP